jgi:hypothetical protein
MSLDSEHQLANTERKLAQIEQQIKLATSRPGTPENAESLQSLIRTANQLREEVAQYRARRKRQAS